MTNTPVSTAEQIKAAVGSGVDVGVHTLIEKLVADLQGLKVDLALGTPGSELPTSDPAVAGALWNNSGVVTVSAG